MSNGDATHRVQNGDKTAPEVRAKPRHLVSKSVSPQLQSNGNTSSTPDELQSRFNKLSFSSKNGGRPSSVPPNGLPTSLIPGFGRPHGPREMPSPGPLRVDVKNVMPRLPAPVYSPSTSYGSPGGIPPQRSSRSQSIVADIVKPKLPLTTDISLTAEALFAFLKAGGFSVLLLDIRPREEFNQGHIFSRSTVCIEPITLREG
jgi:ubiquitin carboxyl-terminal hydrolase 8